jgi:uncharacterized membrane protein YgcG
MANRGGRGAPACSSGQHHKKWCRPMSTFHHVTLYHVTSYHVTLYHTTSRHRTQLHCTTPLRHTEPHCTAPHCTPAVPHRTPPPATAPLRHRRYTGTMDAVPPCPGLVRRRRSRVVAEPTPVEPEKLTVGTSGDNPVLRNLESLARIRAVRKFVLETGGASEIKSSKVGCWDFRRGNNTLRWSPSPSSGGRGSGGSGKGGGPKGGAGSGSRSSNSRSSGGGGPATAPFGRATRPRDALPAVGLGSVLVASKFLTHPTSLWHMLPESSPNRLSIWPRNIAAPSALAVVARWHGRMLR